TARPRTALVTVVLARGACAAQLADEGYTTTPVKGKNVTVTCAVAIGNNLYAVLQPQRYTVKPGPMGFSTNPPR
ncbi:MAG: hypothetical protein NTW87_21250, partial [Planctomycetota bacterium]|nr:hypothetical protein [Planctomycetota bacterium]